MQRTPILLLLTLATTSLVLAGCTTSTGDPEIYGSSTGGTIQDDTIKQAGSSTVLPIAEVWAEDFGITRGVQISVAGGGSGAGATGLCDGDLDIGDMSREMKESEKETCRANGIEPVQWKVAFDGITIAVSNSNQFVESLSVDQLAHIFRAEDPATTWRDVDPDYPNEEIFLCYPDSDSGTYEYFNDEILDGGEPRDDAEFIQQSPDDNVLVRCVDNNELAIGYFGFAYYLENTGKLRAVSVDGVLPSFETIADGSYQPLGRPIFMYTDGVPTGLLGDYFHYAFHPEGGQSHVPDVGYVALDEDTRLAMIAQLED